MTVDGGAPDHEARPSHDTPPSTVYRLLSPEFRSFLASLDKHARTVILHDSDADGVTSGVVLQLALQRRGFEDVVRVIPNRERDAWSPSNRALLAAQNPKALFVLDLGSREEPLADCPTCIVDHHRPDGVPPNAVLLTGYTLDPIPNTSIIVYELFADDGDIEDLDWIAAIGALSDVGEKAPFALLASVKKKYAMTDLKEVTSLVNAARRASTFDPELAARVLLTHSSAREIVKSQSEDVQRLRKMRDEVRRELAEGKKAAPKFAGNVALVRVRSSCQIHPVIAQIWRTRLPKYVVIVANDGYLDGRVNFSMRTESETNLLDFLRAIDLGEGEGSYARGHDKATGGSLPRERWELLLRKIGFS